MKALRAVVVSALAFLIAASAKAAVTREDIEGVLKGNPDLILDVLRQNHKELYKIVNEAFQEEQASRQQEEEEKRKQELEDSFRHPLKPEISNKTLVRGKRNAFLTLVEYSDFQCPYCSRAAATVEELRKKYGAKLRFIYKNLPLVQIHSNALPAAQYFEAVALQSPEKAWLFHDQLFKNQEKLGTEFYRETIKSLGLDVKKADEDAQSQAVQQAIQADMEEAHGFGFNGTPGFLLNGVPIRGAFPLDYFERIIDRLEHPNKGGPKPEKKGS